MSEINQDNRLIHVTAPGGEYIATEFIGEEYISDLFRFEVQLYSNNHAIQQKDIVGKAITVKLLNSGEDKPRFVNGYVNHLSLTDINENGLRGYRAVIVPGFWFTSLGSNNRVFHECDAKQILQDVLGEYAAVISLQVKLNATYVKREYCVQFDESDFEFACRIMAEEGISYYFTHSDGKHQMVLTDDPQGYFDSETTPVEYDGGGSQPTKDTIHSWQRSFNYHTGGVEFKDYNEFTSTKDNIQTVNTTSKLNSVSAYKMREYGNYKFEVDGDSQHKFLDSANTQLNQISMEAHEVGFDLAQGSSDCTVFAAGGRFEIDHPIESERGKYLLRHVHIVARDSNTEDTVFQNEFSCIPFDTPVRPDPKSFRKRISYTQTATVLEVKATGSDSSKDPYTQLKVKFPWNTKQNSCWLRVMQSFAGKKWGANFVPRVGQEVVISFLDGNPDRPLVTGAVYNGTNEGPNYTATQSGWKTQFDSSAFNELRFDDKGGEEEIYMEAGKDHNWLVHNDQTGKVENNQALEVKMNRDVTVTDGNETTVIAKGNQVNKVDTGNQENSVKGNQTVKVDGNQSDTVKGSKTVKVTGAVKVQSNASIELKVGGSSIKITPASIEIKSTKISINGSAMTEVKGGGMLTLKGGVTMIN